MKYTHVFTHTAMRCVRASTVVVLTQAAVVLRRPLQPQHATAPDLQNCWGVVQKRGGGAMLWGSPGDALEGKGPRRRPQKRLGRRLEEVAKAVTVGYKCH